ncbi:MAG: CbiQ family ECF transporter T component [Synechococcales cyanobacterium]
MDILRHIPLGTYVESPRSWLHRLDARVKMIWLISLILSPILATSLWRLGLVAALILITATALPWRLWWRPCGALLLAGSLMLTLTALSPDALGVDPAPQRQDARDPDYGWVIRTTSHSTSSPASETEPRPAPQSEGGSPLVGSLPQPTAYRYEVFSQRLGGMTLRLSRRSLALAVRVGTLVFTLFYVSTLFLLTTAPEEITAGLASLAAPLQRFGIPVAEITLTTTLSLRFLPLVVEEGQNLIRAVRTRDVDWQGLGFRGGVQMVVALVDRLLENLLLRAAQTAQAMQVRGYIGPDHPLPWAPPRLHLWDYGVLALVPCFWYLRLTLFSSLG